MILQVSNPVWIPCKCIWLRPTQWLNGDGAISSFRIKDGNVDFKQRFVQTEKFRVEAIENRALLGKQPYAANGNLTK